MQKGSVTAGGPRITYDVGGDGPAVVFVHGITDDGTTWEPVTSVLTGDLTCVRVDLRGHGGSAAGPPWDQATMASDVARVVQELGLQRPHVVGHSLGGMVATFLAGQIPVASVVNVDQPLRLDAFAAGLRAIEPQLRGPEFGETMVAVSRSLGVERLAPDVQDELDSHRRRVDPAVVLGIWDVVFSSTEDDLVALVESAARRVDAPYLALHGSDPGDPYREWLATAIPTSRLEVWEGDGHYPHLVRPDEFRDALLRFLDGATTGTEPTS